MTRARFRALLILGVLEQPTPLPRLLLGAGLILGMQPPRQPGERPTLLLLTSLPLVFGEEFSLQQEGSPALEALETRYRVVPISVTDPNELAKGRLLLMAHPLAQPAEEMLRCTSPVLTPSQNIVER